MGEAGKRAIQMFLDRGVSAGLIAPLGEIEFVE